MARLLVSEAMDTENYLFLLGFGLMALAAWTFWRRPKFDAETLLLGTWQSNRDFSIATMLPSVCLLPQKAVDDFFSIFGLLRVTYTPESLISTMPAMGEHEQWNATRAYRVRSSKGRKITIESTDESSGEVTVTTIHFISPDRYWVDISGKVKPFAKRMDTTAWREYFDRVR